jgi:syntaxin-binding protein 1
MELTTVSFNCSSFNSTKLISSKEINDSEYTSSRYVCEFKSILQQLAEKTLSPDIYPGTVPLPDEGTSVGVAQSVRMTTVSSSVRKTPSTLNRSRINDAKKLNDKPRIIAFVLGGACFSELRSAQEIMDKFGSEVIIGSTNFITPEDFVNELASLS